ncbi:hypothetical protein Ahy_B09g094848 [Arachis hypogaea]|uniref:Disease resistance protein n=1 Tax=Arachis hypogaea TaxID=3818 RepID=A0A444XCE1_ARAHY|nr:hypothetical protein Ahy_B09g094848 [Arachis hypogaea]
MAEALLGVVLEKLTPLILNEFAAFFGIKEKAEELTLTLELIKAVLDDAEEKQWSNRPLKVWLQQLKNAMYLSTQSSQPGCLSSLNPKNMIHRRELGKKLNKIIGRLDRIAQRRSNFDLRQVVRKRSSEVAEWRQTSSTIALPQVYGRDEDKKKVVEFLLSPSRSSESLSVYPIVGLGGLGKTTLVQMVYNDQQVGNHFDLKIWVCVSENFTRGSMLRSILKAMEVDKYESMDLDAMEKKVKELLQGKKYLLVLDDVWKRSQEMELGLTQHKWDELRTSSFENVESLRTLYQMNSYGFEKFSSSLVRTNHSLRVLCLYCRNITSFGSLSCLRYLELRELNILIESLPGSICNLRKLEILKLKEMWRLRGLPKHLTRIRNL